MKSRASQPHSTAGPDQEFKQHPAIMFKLSLYHYVKLLRSLPRSLLAVLWLLLTACTMLGAGERSEGATDPETGLPLNPVFIPTGRFVVEGVVRGMDLTRPVAPEFVIEAPSGQSYRVRSQPLSQILFDDGEPVTVEALQEGLSVRATVARDPDTTFLVSKDLTFVRAPLPREELGEGTR